MKKKTPFWTRVMNFFTVQSGTYKAIERELDLTAIDKISRDKHAAVKDTGYSDKKFR
jgi:hypothetical protein